VAIVGGFGRLGEGNAVCRKRGMLGIMQRRLYSKVAIAGGFGKLGAVCRKRGEYWESYGVDYTAKWR
jgi:hypothetical protein